MKRYNAVVGGVYDPSVMVEEKDGDYVWYEDVEHLEANNAELLEALEDVYYPIVSWLGEFDSESSLSSNPAMQKARAAIAKAKGEEEEL